MKDSVKKSSEEPRRLTQKDCEKEAGRGGRQSEDEREKQGQGEWRSEQGEQNEVENKYGRKRQDCTQHEARQTEGMEVDGGIRFQNKGGVYYRK